jgi:cytochrome c oxidase subunit I
MIYSAMKGRKAGANPWRALTLEWATSSPPPATNFVGDPVPYRDPYGYGTKDAYDYLEMQEKKYSLGAASSTTERALAPQPGAGD